MKTHKQQRKQRNKKPEQRDFFEHWSEAKTIYQTPFVYKINDAPAGAGCGNGWKLLQEVFAERGWVDLHAEEGRFKLNYSSFSGNEDDASGSSTPSDASSDCDADYRRVDCWNLWWRTANLKSSGKMPLKPWQVTNHFRNWSNFSRKDYLARYLKRMQQNHGTIYSFSPVSFHMPLDYTRLCHEHSRRSTEMGACYDPGLALSPVWICKPVSKSQGRGIQVFNAVTSLTYDTACVVQEYVMRPYLIGGYKWDLRIYVCILQMNPPLVYAYREGLARFATKKYNLRMPFDPFVHLTNTTINKYSPSYGDCKDVVGMGCKWTLQRLRAHFREMGECDWLLWQKIAVILILTVIGETCIHGRSTTSGDRNKNKCFELLGFDIMVDEKLKPMLLEVNTNPSLGNDCYVDEMVKRPMLHDLMTLLGFPDDRASTGIDNISDTSCEWVQIFPFSKETEQISCMTNKTLRSSVEKIQYFVKLAKKLSKNGDLDDHQRDNTLKSHGYFTNGAWHPM